MTDASRAGAPGVPDLPSPWRASFLTFGMALVGGSVIGYFVATTAGTAAGFVAGAIVGGILTTAELLAAWRLRFALAAFAEAFGTTRREGFQDWTSRQGIRWPDLGLEVSGRVASYLVHSLEIQAPRDGAIIKPRDARQAGADWARRLFAARVTAHVHDR